jgi:hypothetical protein
MRKCGNKQKSSENLKIFLLFACANEGFGLGDLVGFRLRDLEGFGLGESFLFSSTPKRQKKFKQNALSSPLKASYLQCRLLPNPSDVAGATPKNVKCDASYLSQLPLSKLPVRSFSRLPLGDSTPLFLAFLACFFSEK